NTKCDQRQGAAGNHDRRMRLAPATPTESTANTDLAARVLPNVQLPRPRRWPTVLRLALVAVALAQLGIATANLAGPLGLHTAMSASAHMGHEITAFNLAFGIALLVIAVNPRRASGHVPVLASFLLVLAATSAIDLSSGDVGWARLATHVPIVVGLLLAAALTRVPTTPPGPDNTPAHWDTPTWGTPAASATTAEPGGPGDVRSPPPPVAQHDHLPWRRSA